ncbi:hypothetical protein B0H66DRAFT_374428 [Apodospora peruviana]|uniref:DUF7730 domain-containing protein n=1 Tax=Apodospora peruviana TaxID=516989 RepID=A0AAE0HYC9_9PEZI|nr:hypothetical protein B0H66DRAFT_374428 [Apodospora peruviana]
MLGFLDFPGEIRNQIYSDLLVSSEPIEICVCKGPLSRGRIRKERQDSLYDSDKEEENDGITDCQHDDPLPDEEEIARRGDDIDVGPYTAILATCRQVYREANPVFYSRNRFVIFAKKTAALPVFLDRIGAENAPHIRHLCIPYPHVKVRSDLAHYPTGRLMKAEELRAAAYAIDDDRPVFALSKPQFLDLMKERCTGLETIETLVHTGEGLQLYLHWHGLMEDVMSLMDSLFRSVVGREGKVVVNLYEWHSGQQWFKVAQGYGWTTVVHPNPKPKESEYHDGDDFIVFCGGPETDDEDDY